MSQPSSASVLQKFVWRWLRKWIISRCEWSWVRGKGESFNPKIIENLQETGKNWVNLNEIHLQRAASLVQFFLFMVVTDDRNDPSLTNVELSHDFNIDRFKGKIVMFILFFIVKLQQLAKPTPFKFETLFTSSRWFNSPFLCQIYLKFQPFSNFQNKISIFRNYSDSKLYTREIF